MLLQNDGVFRRQLLASLNDFKDIFVHLVGTLNELKDVIVNNHVLVKTGCVDDGLKGGVGDLPDIDGIDLDGGE